MAETFKGYYLPPSLADVERRLEMEERPLGEARLLLPRLKPEDAYAIASTLRESRAKVAAMPVADIAEAYDRAIGFWKDHMRPEKQAALKYLPQLTGLSPEMIERYHFGALYRIDRRAIEAYAALQLGGDVLKRFVPLESMGTYLKGHAGVMGRIWLKLNVFRPEGVSLVTFLAPAGTPGYFECLGLLLGSIARSATLVKTSSGQPLFAPMFARALAAASPGIGETIAVLPWQGGDAAIEDVVFRQSNAVCVVGSQATAKAVEKRIVDLNRREHLNIKGCYHGGKCGLELIAREYATRDVAKLAAVDGIGYEGRMCFSPAYGIFVERGGPLSPEQFAEAVAEEAGQLSLAIPQMPASREAREKKVAAIQAAPAQGRRVITAPVKDFAVVYEPVPVMKPDSQDRLFRIMPVDRLEDIVPLMKPVAASLQTAGIAIPDRRLIDLADRLGKAGISSLRVAGTMTLPKLGEAWDGNLPVLEYYLPDAARWVSINVISVDREIGRLTRSG